MKEQGVCCETRALDVGDMLDFWSRYTMDLVFDDTDGWEVQNLLLVGALMVQAARWRTESRGAHRRCDFPDADDNFRCRAFWKRSNPGPVIRRLARESVA